MNVVWEFDKRVPLEHHGALAYDDFYGVESELYDSVEIEHPSGTQRFLVSATGAHNYGWYREHLKTFVDAIMAEADISDANTIMGDFWPDGVGINEGYDVRTIEYYSGTEIMMICWLDPDPE